LENLNLRRDSKERERVLSYLLDNGGLSKWGRDMSSSIREQGEELLF
jgi:hypothetical protein